MHERACARPADGRRGTPRPALRRDPRRPGRALHRYPELAPPGPALPRRDRRPQAVEGFAAAARRATGGAVRRGTSPPTGDDVAERVARARRRARRRRVRRLARPVPGGTAIQLCQGHCPVQHVAHEFPAAVRGRGPGVLPAPRRARPAPRDPRGGGHVCTTNIPLHDPTHHAPHPARSVEGIQMSAQTDAPRRRPALPMTQDEAIASIGNYNYGWHDADPAGAAPAWPVRGRGPQHLGPRRTSPSGCSRRG